MKTVQSKEARMRFFKNPFRKTPIQEAVPVATGQQKELAPQELEQLASTATTFQCGHEGLLPYTLVVLGVEVTLKKAPRCAVCALEYLNQYASLCATCSHPIYPGDDVAPAYDGATLPYQHLRCADTLAFHCGRLGEGRLITLHELRPDKYPEGTGTAIGHCIDTARPVVENPH